MTDNKVIVSENQTLIGNRVTARQRVANRCNYWRHIHLRQTFETLYHWFNRTIITSICHTRMSKPRYYFVSTLNYISFTKAMFTFHLNIFEGLKNKCYQKSIVRIIYDLRKFKGISLSVSRSKLSSQIVCRRCTTFTTMTRQLNVGQSPQAIRIILTSNNTCLHRSIYQVSFMLTCQKRLTFRENVFLSTYVCIFLISISSGDDLGDLEVRNWNIRKRQNVYKAFERFLQ